MPHDYDYTKMEFDGVFLSNGPGDPRLLSKSVEILAKAMDIGKPIFGICMVSPSGSKKARHAHLRPATRHPLTTAPSPSMPASFLRETS